MSSPHMSRSAPGEGGLVGKRRGGVSSVAVRALLAQ